MLNHFFLQLEEMREVDDGFSETKKTSALVE